MKFVKPGSNYEIQGRRKTVLPAKPIYQTYGKLFAISKTINYRSVGQTVQKLQLIVIWMLFGCLLTLKELSPYFLRLEIAYCETYDLVKYSLEGIRSEMKALYDKGSFEFLPWNWLE